MRILTAMASKDLLIIAINILRRTIIDETHHSANREVPTVEVKAAYPRVRRSKLEEVPQSPFMKCFIY